MIINHEYQPEYSPLQKIALAAVLLFALMITGIAGNFVYGFIQTYKAELTTGLFYLCGVLGLATVILIASATAYAVCMLWLRVESSRAENALKMQNIHTITAANELHAATIRQLDKGQIYLTEQRNHDGMVKFKALPKHQTKPKELPREPETAAPAVMALPQPKTTLLSDIEPLQRLLIVGGQNSGKTTLLKHIAHQRSRAGDVLILDSHNHAGKWNDNFRIVGHGRNYQAIETELKNLVAVMDARYKEFATGKVREREHDLITVISDEWTTIAENLSNLDGVLLPLLTESRKVGIDFIIACHSETASSLGLKGRFDLKKNFDAILRLKNYSGNRVIHLDNGETIEEYQHCGMFKENPKLQTFNKSLDKILSPDAIKEQSILDCYNELISSNSFSWNKLALMVYGKKGGHYTGELKAVLNAHNIHFTD